MKSHRISSVRFSTLLATMLLVMASAKGQDNDILLFGSQHELNASRVLPSTFGTDDEDLNFWFSMPYVHLSAGQDFIRKNELIEVLDGGEVPSSLVSNVVDRMDKRNRIWASAEVTPLALGWRIRSEGEEILSMNFSITEQVFAKGVLGSGLFEVAWYGNKPYAGTIKELGPIEADAIWQREIALGAAFPLAENEDFKLRGGFRAKYLMGIAGGNMRPTISSLTTAADGSEIAFDLLVKGRVAGFDDINPMGPGGGFATDFGASLEHDRWSVDFSLLDLGFVKFADDLTTYTLEGKEDFVGLNLEEAFDGEITFTDSLEQYIGSSEVDGGEVILATSARMVLRGGYQIPALDRNGRSYAKHAFFLSYIQGFVEGPRSSFEPIITTAYAFNLNNIFEVGTSIGYAHEDLDLGAFLSVRGGPFSFGLASSDFAGLILGSSKVSADASMQFSFVF